MFFKTMKTRPTWSGNIKSKDKLEKNNTVTTEEASHRLGTKMTNSSEEQTQMWVINISNMSEHSASNNKTLSKPLPSPQYTWEYEYYEYAQVSFEGLKAHKYSIVIGFWVGLAVFVIFMFFVLTLLTKTGAPHQENVDVSEKRFQVDRFTAHFRRSLDTNKVLSCQVEETRSLFHCYINEVDQQERTKSSKDIGDSGILIQQTVRNCKVEVEMDGPPRFNIPNFVSTEQNSSVGEEDLLIDDPTIILENRPVNSSQSNFLNE